MIIMYVSKHWSVSEWDCWRRNKNAYAWDDENGCLCTEDSKTEKLFRILDSLRECDSDWVINTTGYHAEYGTSFKSGFRTVDGGVNAACGGAVGSYHTRGCAADIHVAGKEYTAEQLQEMVLTAAGWQGIDGSELGLGCYGDWLHLDTRGYCSRW